MSPSPAFTQDPQSNVVLHVQEGVCMVLFEVWDDQGEALPGQQGRIRFTDCWAAEHVALSPEAPNHRERCLPNAFLWQDSASPWLAEKIATRLRQYPTWLEWDRRTYRHYVVEGHDTYCQVIATSFELDLVTHETVLHQ
jgi:hypothetical protein